MKVCVHLHTDDHLKEMSVCDGRRGSGGKGRGMRGDSEVVPLSLAQ